MTLPKTRRVADPSRRNEPALANGVQSRWTFMTNHAYVLALLLQHPTMVLREVATRVGITERAVQRIIQELDEEEYIIRTKIGRKNHYRVLGKKSLRHPLVDHCSIHSLLALIEKKEARDNHG